MSMLLKEIRHNPLLWLLAFVPVVFASEHLRPGSVVTNGGRSAWFVGFLVLMVYLTVAMRLYRLPPKAQ